MDNLMLSNLSDYQAEIVSSFEAFLVGQQASKKTLLNYLSDVRHFLRWIPSRIRQSEEESGSKETFVRSVKTEHVQSYKQDLLLSRVPATTVNRRLSAIRMFFRFCVREGWIIDNPTESVGNIPTAAPKLPTVDPEILAAYAKALMREETSDRVTQELTDISEFIQWINTQGNHE